MSGWPTSGVTQRGRKTMEIRSRRRFQGLRNIPFRAWSRAGSALTALAALTGLVLLAGLGSAAPIVQNGEFGSGFNGWTTVAVSSGSYGSPFPKIEIHYDFGGSNPSAALDTPGGADAYLEQSIALPAAASAQLTFVTWGHNQAVTVTVSLFDQNGTNHVLGQFDPTCKIDSGCTSVESKSYDVSSYLGQTVTLRFRCTASGGLGTIADFDNITVTAYWQGPPLNLVALAGDTAVNLSWSPPATNSTLPIVGYNLYRGPDALNLTLYRSSGVAIGFRDTNVSNGVTYCYGLRARNSLWEGNSSTSACATPAGVPSEPRSFAAVAGDAHVTLSWVLPQNNGSVPLTSYNLYRSTAGGPMTLYRVALSAEAFDDWNVSNGQTYVYRVSAVNYLWEGNQSVSVSAVPAGVPSEPRSLAAVAGDAHVELSWVLPQSNGSVPLTGYILYRSTAGGPMTMYRAVPPAGTFDDWNVSNGQTYVYRVSAVNYLWEGNQSVSVSAVPAGVPSEPRSLAAVASDAHVTLSWVLPQSNGSVPLTGYNLYRSTAGGPMSLYRAALPFGTFDDINVSNGISYTYWLTALNYLWESNRSAPASAVPEGVPGAPRLLTAVPGDAIVTLTWSPPPTSGGVPVNTYRLMRGLSAGSLAPYGPLRVALAYSDTHVQNGLTYFYAVIAINDLWEGSPSAGVNATPLGAPGHPYNVTGTGGNAVVILHWAAPADTGGGPLAGFKIWRGESPATLTFHATLGNFTAFEDAGVSNGQTYWYALSAFNAMWDGTLSLAVSALPAAPPTAPRDVTLEAPDVQVVFRWSAPASDGGLPIDAYRVYRGSSPANLTFRASLAAVFEFIDNGVTNGETYYYAVSAFNGRAEGPLSDPQSAVPAAVPSAPLQLTAMAGDSRVDLQWIAPADNGGLNITSYVVYRGSERNSLVPLAGGVTGTEYTDLEVSNGVVYYYQVRATNARGNGTLSAMVSAAPRTVPEPPRFVNASAQGARIVVTWAAPPSNGGAAVTAFEVYRSENGGSFTKVASLSNVTTFVDQNVTPGISYSYEVRARNPAGEGPSAASTSVSIAPPTPIATTGADLTALFAGVFLALAAIGGLAVLRRDRGRNDDENPPGPVASPTISGSPAFTPATEESARRRAEVEQLFKPMSGFSIGAGSALGDEQAGAPLLSPGNDIGIVDESAAEGASAPMRHPRRPAAPRGSVEEMRILGDRSAAAGLPAGDDPSAEGARLGVRRARNVSWRQPEQTRSTTRPPSSQSESEHLATDSEVPRAKRRRIRKL
jgi:fibronectin type 3 domain-containing protein